MLGLKMLPSLLREQEAPHLRTRCETLGLFLLGERA